MNDVTETLEEWADERRKAERLDDGDPQIQTLSKCSQLAHFAERAESDGAFVAASDFWWQAMALVSVELSGERVQGPRTRQLFRNNARWYRFKAERCERKINGDREREHLDEELELLQYAAEEMEGNQ